MRKIQDTNSLISQFVDDSVIKSMKNFTTSDDLKKIEKASCDISALFGNKNDFLAIVQNSNNDKAGEEKLITSFNNNLNLLVQKTWVEKSDEALKEQVLGRLENIGVEVRKNAYAASYSAFVAVLHDIVYLMFGSQAKKEDFAEYALRIDPGFGIFWWFLTELPKDSGWSNEKSRIAMLLGMFFLANY